MVHAGLCSQTHTKVFAEEHGLEHPLPNPNTLTHHGCNTSIATLVASIATPQPSVFFQKVMQMKHRTIVFPAKRCIS